MPAVPLLQYKFIVDGEWKYAPEQPAMYDERGNVNNVIEVQEYQPENLDNLSSFQAPSSPVSSYDNVRAAASPAPPAASLLDSAIDSCSPLLLPPACASLA